MKKIVSLLLVLAMMMAFAACGAQKAPETTAPATQPVETTEAPVETTAAPPRLTIWPF